MPIKNKKITPSAKKKQTSKPSRSVAKKAVKASVKKPVVKKAVKVSPKKKPLSKPMAPISKASTKKLPAKKKGANVPASKKVIKKVKVAEKIGGAKKTNQNKKSNAPSQKAPVTVSKLSPPKTVKKMVKKVTTSVKKQIPNSTKPTNLVKKTATKSNLSANQRKPEEQKKPAPLKTTATQRARRPGAGPSGFLPYETKGNEDYMSDEQLLHFQRVLNLWKEQLFADREATAQHMRDDTVNFPDPLDRAALEEEHTLEWRAREREHKLIAKIDQALAHIKQGNYGYCEACGAEIGVRRLEARPTATQCIDCKTIDEIRERHTGTME